MVTLFRGQCEHFRAECMIPLRDTVRSRSVPVVNYLLIITCGIVFVFELSLGPRLGSFLRTYAVIPAGIAESYHLGVIHPRAYFSLVSSMFLHGGWVHLIGNMLYLYVFGDNIEDRLGHFGYLIFYVLCGITSALTQVFFSQDSLVPVIGASGAIAGVLGAYFLLYPRARILTMIPLVIFFPVVELSAFFFLGFWFMMQFLQAALASGTELSGGVALWAHAGGFVAGAVFLPVFLLLRPK